MKVDVNAEISLHMSGNPEAWTVIQTQSAVAG